MPDGKAGEPNPNGGRPGLVPLVRCRWQMMASIRSEIPGDVGVAAYDLYKDYESRIASPFRSIVIELVRATRRQHTLSLLKDWRFSIRPGIVPAMKKAS
jgi:hypothetical protein